MSSSIGPRGRHSSLPRTMPPKSFPTLWFVPPIEGQLAHGDGAVGHLKRELAHGPEAVERHEVLSDLYVEISVDLPVDERIEDGGSRPVTEIATGDRELEDVEEVRTVGVAGQVDARRPDRE